MQLVNDLIYTLRNLPVDAVYFQQNHAELIEHTAEPVQKQDFLPFRCLDMETGDIEAFIHFG